MKRILTALGVVLLMGATSYLPATGPMGPINQSGSASAETLALTTATAIPATAYARRITLYVQNLGAAGVFCGFSNSVTTGTGWEIFPNGGDVTLAVGDGMTLYCIAAVSQTIGTGLRTMELR